MRHLYNCLGSSSKTWKWKRLDKWRMQRPQAEFPLDFFPYHKVKLKREQARDQLRRVPAECCSRGGCQGMLCVVWESVLHEWEVGELMHECGMEWKEVWTTWRCSDTAASRDHNKHLARLTEYCSFCWSSGIMNLVFPFVFCAPDFAVQVANTLKEGLNGNWR